MVKKNFKKVVYFILLPFSWLGNLVVTKKQQLELDIIKQRAKKERQKIIGEGYKQINDAKKELASEREQTRLFVLKETNSLNNEKKDLSNFRQILNEKEQQLDETKQRLESFEKEIELKNKSLITKLEKFSSLSSQQAEKELRDSIKYKVAKETSSYVFEQEREARRQVKQKANEILVNAMERYATDIVESNATSFVSIPDEKMKGRIIGKEGRNIKTFEQFAGVDILIDETPDTIMVSSFNPIRREIAVRTLNALISDGRIQPVKIEQELKKQKELLDEIIQDTGQKVVDELGIYDFDHQLVYLIGKLKYRTSYSQNVLNHSIEVAKISCAIAQELGLNTNQAIRAGLLHDIGKAIDFEQDGNHVELGVKIAKQFGENQIIINAIEAHHEDVAKTNLISEIVSIADSISASRPGSRNNGFEDFAKRMSEIEELINNVPGVIKSYAVQSGRQIRVMVNPSIVNDENLIDLKLQIKELLKNNITIPGDIVLTLIRETRQTEIIK